MKNIATVKNECRSVSWLFILPYVRTANFAFSGGLLFLAWDDSVWRSASIISILALIAVLAFAALVASAWYAFRGRANRRWRAALDRYTAQEEKKITNSRRILHAHPQP
jgi:hypothetical protein